jgi:hypothetical protein
MSADPSLRNWKTSGGEPLWAAGDRVHLTLAAYLDIATTILEAGIEMENDVASSVTTSSDRSSRLESVVTRPIDNINKHCRGTGALAGWLIGKVEPQGGGS